MNIIDEIFAKFKYKKFLKIILIQNIMKNQKFQANETK